VEHPLDGRIVDFTPCRTQASFLSPSGTHTKTMDISRCLEKRHRLRDAAWLFSHYSASL